MKIARYVLSMYQTNCYLVMDEDSNQGFIVDPGGYTAQLTEQVKEEGVDITYILLTHAHSDHRAGLDGFKKDFPEAKVVIHEVEAPELTGMTDFGNAVETEADLLVKDGEELKFGAYTLRFLFTPGHTRGGMCIYLPEAGILFSGDTLFRQSIGRTDFAGGSFPEIENSIRTKLYTLPEETQVFPGHMAPTTIGFEKEHNPFVTL